MGTDIHTKQTESVKVKFRVFELNFSLPDKFPEETAKTSSHLLTLTKILKHNR